MDCPGKKILHGTAKKWAHSRKFELHNSKYRWLPSDVIHACGRSHKQHLSASSGSSHMFAWLCSSECLTWALGSTLCYNFGLPWVPSIVQLLLVQLLGVWGLSKWAAFLRILYFHKGRRNSTLKKSLDVCVVATLIGHRLQVNTYIWSLVIILVYSILLLQPSL